MLGKGQCKICDKKIMTWNFPYRPWYQPSAWYGSLWLIPGPIWKMSCNNLHRCQPLWFFRNCYKFRAKITMLRISDYCRPRTVPHLNIIVIILMLHCLLKWRKDKHLRDFDYLILLGFSGLSIVENDLSISCAILSS